MNSRTLDKLVARCADLYNIDFDQYLLQDKYSEFIEYPDEKLYHFNDDLIEKAYAVRLSMVRNAFDKNEFKRFLSIMEHPILVYQYTPENALRPLILHKKKNGKLFGIDVEYEEEEEIEHINGLINTLRPYRATAQRDQLGKIIVMIIFPLEYLTSKTESQTGDKTGKMTPVQRFFNLLRTERKDITFIYIYAVAIVLINLSLPLGIQAIIGLISGGMVFNSVVLLIALVVAAILIGGALQIMQITLVEVLQRRVFARTAMEFSFRLPRITYESLAKYYPPELVNRFFDVTTVQKGLPKILIDITGAILQIVFGLLVLTFYHPVFLAFGGFLAVFLVVVFVITGPKGLSSSLSESDFKYKVAHWLEELARNINSFKLAGQTELPLQKTDQYVGSYLFHRRTHFGVLINQFIYILGFKVFITGGLLALGTWLVVERQITLGQFVASEIIIVTIVASVEKIIANMDVVYDMLTGLAKLGKVTDMPLEKQEGLHLSLDKYDRGIKITAKDLKYKYNGAKNFALYNVSFEVNPSESICIVGTNNSGKSTLVQILSGVLETYEGSITINDINLRDMSLMSLRNSMEKKVYEEDIFDGTILDNISIGRSHITFEDVVWACDNLGLSDMINSLPDGYHTNLVAGGKGFSSSIVNKICLARNVADRPKMIIVDDFMQDLDNREKVRIVNFLLDSTNPWTLMCMTNDPFLMSACDKVLLLDEGKVVGFGPYQELRTHPVMIESAYHE